MDEIRWSIFTKIKRWKIGYERYGVKLFGNIVNEYGLGFGSNVASGYYFFWTHLMLEY